MQETDFNLITPKQNDKILDVEISFTDKRGITDKEFRDEVIDEVYDIIFTELELTSLGIQFKVNLKEDFVKENNIIGYQIVRCEKTFNYTKNILQCALARPVY